MPDWYWIVISAVFGACVGSFLNVVIYRLPAGESLWSPPSHDPKTGDRLKWWENIPIVSWLALRGRSRYSSERISVQYPLVEAATALLFGGLTAIYLLSGEWPMLAALGFERTWPLILVHLVLAASLLAATVVDAKLFIIPLQVPWFATVVAVLLLPLAVWLGWLPVQVVDAAGLTVGAAGVGAGLCGVAGLLLAAGLLWLGVLPQSFADEQQVYEQMQAERDVATDAAGESNAAQPAGGPEQWLTYPYARREMLKETLFVALPTLGVILGWYFTPNISAKAIHPAMATLGGVLMGYLVGAGLIWFTRIGGTLLFDKEAMGLGDVHLLAAIGAVLGWYASVMVYFIAPFMGIAGALCLIGVTAIRKKEVQAVPYGPYLAAAALLVMVLNHTVRTVFPF